jgi:two-component system response regulator FlrC
MKDYGLFQTNSTKLMEVLDRCGQIALTPTSVLISGESGTGKSTLARYIVQRSRSVLAPIVWNPQISASDLKNQDTVIVDDLSQLTAEMQARLSGVVDQCRMDRSKYVRWIAMISQDPTELLRLERLRKDLFYRFGVFHFEMPSLKNRSDDIADLAELFVRVSSLMANKGEKQLSHSAIEKLQACPWVGNVRELESVIERAVASSMSPVIGESELCFQTTSDLTPHAFTGQTLSDMERKLIIQTLEITQQNKTRAAQLLGISIRTLRNKLNEYRAAGVL